MINRIPLLKQSTVRVFVNGSPCGSGFAVADDLVATCFHVVQEVSATPTGQTRITYATSIEVELPTGQRVAAQVHPCCQNNGFGNAVSRDFVVLQVHRATLRPLPMGSLSSAAEGEPVYMAGFPFGIDQAVVATGIISTKWLASGYLNEGSTREAAWIDITMNSGNSGGPVLRLGTSEVDDEVIGIAAFGLNPFAAVAKGLAQVAAAFPGSVHLLDVDFKHFATLIGDALKSNSLGVGGLITIDYARAAACGRW